METFEVIVEPDEEQSLEKQVDANYYPTEDLQEDEGNSNFIDGNPMKDASFGENTTSWAKYNPQMLRTPKSGSLVPGREQNGSCNKRQRQNTIVTKVSQWVNVKAELEFKRKEQIDEEHTLKLKLMKEKHDLQMLILKQESETKVKHMDMENEQKIELMKEERKLKIEILQLEKLQILRKKQPL